MRSFENDWIQAIWRVKKGVYGELATTPEVFNINYMDTRNLYVVGNRENRFNSSNEYLIQFDDTTNGTRTNKWVDFNHLRNSEVMRGKIDRFKTIWSDLGISEDWDMTYHIPFGYITTNLYRKTQSNDYDYASAREIIRSWRPTF